MKLTITMFLAIAILGHIYLCIRSYQAFEYVPMLRIPAICTIIFIFLTYFLSQMGLTDNFGFTVNQALKFFTSGWIFLFLILVLAFGFADLVRLLEHFFHFFPSLIKDNYIITKFILMIVLIIFTAFLNIIGYFNFVVPKKTELNITLNKSIQDIATGSADTLNIVAVSDLHLGYTIHKDRLRKFVDSINSQNPDIVFIVGDLIDGNIYSVVEQNMHEELSSIKSKYGVYVVLGNHERYSRKQDKIIEYYRKAGLIVLLDSVSLVDNKFYVVGRKDRTTHDRLETKELVKNLDTTKPIILLDHQPYNLEKSEEAGIDLHLSGHTHDGQFFPINLITRAVYEVSYGYKLKSNTHVYVTSGLGLWGPHIRIGTKSEFVVIKLQGNSPK